MVVQGEGWAARTRERDLRERLTMSSKLEKGIIKQTCIRIFRKQAVPRGLNNELAMTGKWTRLLKREAGLGD